jgi:hypothetical protein
MSSDWDSGPDWCHIPRLDDLIKRRTEFTISVMQQKSAVPQKAPLLHGHGPGDLFHPLFIRMRSHSGQTNLASLQTNEKENIIGDQSLECENFNREEIGPG